MFPLGSVLMPAMPLPLRVFEPRYLAMIDEVLDRETLDFGVVLIERGHEVGGGDARFGVGTMARVEQVESSDGLAALVARGSQRFRVDSWLPDDPWPRAELSLVEPLTWDEDDRALLDDAERTVRHSLARASEFVDTMWDATVELSQDPVDRSWQLAGIAPLGALDHVSLLESPSTAHLLANIDALTRAALELIELQGES
ncbi:MAG: LON peptidase substrate-binding domain-containing protein [Aeromicrobium sp.]|uniref:LON peptidase substrate-binding domain-containing protein n=1 Tax=Aeromicrobium sp. TaxID=1871063 RepID=UPI003C68FAC7